MGKVFDGIDAALAGWLRAQPMFFVATAPSDLDGHLNLSPKGIDGTFAVLDHDRVAYLDLTGSGIETVAHLRDDGRIVLMFCAFYGPPRIVRLHGRATAVAVTDPAFALAVEAFPRPTPPGLRSVIEVTVAQVSDSCGFGVPLMDLVGQRPTLPDWAARKGPAGIAAYQATRNRASVDGLPGLPTR
ncbi:MAG: pyridoxamine 5'-phosphate oxidase family protein [Actinomycetota bacterium]|nr:pyridoxamine 5'-phosphate oxidase family protein [Actinomycetota bacterium]